MDTQLPDFVLAQLFNYSLIIPEKNKVTVPSTKMISKGTEINHPKKPSPSEEKKWWLGGNAQYVSILIQDARNVFIDDQALQFLTNILAACKLSLNDVAIINYEKTPVGYTEILQHLKSKKIMLFGVNAPQIQLQFSFPNYQIQPYDNCQFVSAPSLHVLMQTTTESKQAKAQLWQCLKKLFQV